MKEIWWFNHNWGDTNTYLYSFLNVDFFEKKFFPLRLQKRVEAFLLSHPDDTEITRRKRVYTYGKYLHIQHLQPAMSAGDPISLFGDSVLLFNMKQERVQIIRHSNNARSIRNIYQNMWETPYEPIPKNELDIFK